MINTGKKYVISCIIVVIVLLIMFAIVTYIVDPLIHYHKPYDYISYRLLDQRYQNFGILKYFDYDAIITGTSMIQNSSATEFDKLFNVKSIKVPFSGSSHKEINDNLLVAIENNPNIKIISRSLDMTHLFDKSDYMRYDDYPDYLYDNYLYNDVKYVFNKTIFFNFTVPSIINSINGIESTTFDDYGNWNDSRKFGKEVLDKSYSRDIKSDKITPFSLEDKKTIKENFTENVLQIAIDNSNIDFYLFVPPYSIYYWDNLNQNGEINRTIDGLEYMMSLLVPYDNIHLYAFYNEYDLINNLDYYRDNGHYSANVNSQIHKWMREGHNLITKNNYQEYIYEMRDYYLNYNYDALFEIID